MPFGYAALNGNGDFQYWNKEEGEGHVTENSVLHGEVEFRWGDDWSRFYYQSTQVDWRYEFYTWLDAGFGDEQEYEWSKGTIWKLKSIPFIFATLRGELACWRIQDENRLQRQFQQGEGGLWCYRNTLTVEGPWRWTPLCIDPYLKNEFYILQKSGFDKDELYLGLQSLLTDTIRFELAWVWQFRKVERSWITIDAIQSVLSFTF